MLLRIEDTDRERSTDAAIEAILDGLTGSASIGTARSIYQFERAARHREVAEKLLALGPCLLLLRHAARARGDAREGARRRPAAAL